MNKDAQPNDKDEIAAATELLFEDADALADEASSLNAVLLRRQATGEVNKQSVVSSDAAIELPAVKPVNEEKLAKPMANLLSKPYGTARKPVRGASSPEQDSSPHNARDEAAEENGSPNSPDSLRKTERQLEQVRRRQKAYLEERRQQKKRKVLLHRIKRMASMFYFLMLLAAAWVIAQNPFWIFSGKQFQIENNHLLTAKHIQPIVNAYQGWAMYDINPQDIARMIKTHYGIVDQVYVRRVLFPAELSVYVVEKQPFAELYADEASTIPYALVSTDYSLIPLTLYRYKPQSNPDIVRMILPGGMKLTRATLERLHQVSHILRGVPQLHLQDIVVTPVPGSFVTVTAHFAEGTALIGQLDAEAAQRTVRLVGLADKMTELKNEIQAVDLRWSEQITFLKKTNVSMKPQVPQDVLPDADVPLTAVPGAIPVPPPATPYPAQH